MKKFLLVIAAVLAVAACSKHKQATTPTGASNVKPADGASSDAKTAPTPTTEGGGGGGAGGTPDPCAGP